jgi:hypothetical protein
VYIDFDAFRVWDFAAGIYIFKLQLKKKSPHDWKFSEASNDLRFTRGFTISHVRTFITKLLRLHAKSIQIHENGNVRHTGQGETQHRKYYLAAIKLMSRLRNQAVILRNIKQSHYRHGQALRVPGG